MFTTMETALIYTDELWARGFDESHPLKPERLKRTYELLVAYRAFDAPNSRMAAPVPDSREEPRLFHTTEYREQSGIRIQYQDSPEKRSFSPPRRQDRKDLLLLRLPMTRHSERAQRVEESRFSAARAARFLDSFQSLGMTPE